MDGLSKAKQQLFTPSLIMAASSLYHTMNSLVPAILAFLMIFALLPAAAVESCHDLRVGEEVTFVLSATGTNCVQVPGNDTETYGLTIRNSVYGRFSVITESSDGDGWSSGYGWNEPVGGIYYCINGGSQLDFDEYVEGANMTVMTELVDDSCVSDGLSYDGYEPIAVPDNGVTSEVYWSSDRYYLHAMHFEYQVVGEDPVSMEDGTAIEISGDPGDDTYTSIETTWLTSNDLEKRFHAYVNANQTQWWINEIRIYDMTQEWVYFTSQEGLLSGNRESCFTAENVTLSNPSGDEVRFDNLTLAVFLPWASESVFLDCVEPTMPKNETSMPGNESSGACKLTPLLVALLMAAFPAAFASLC